MSRFRLSYSYVFFQGNSLIFITFYNHYNKLDHIRNLLVQCSLYDKEKEEKKALMNILIVEDDIDVSSVLKETIQNWGYSAENADTCKDAMDRVKQKRFDLILLDIFLPDGKGHRLIPQFKELWPDIGIVTMTGYNTRELEMDVREQGILYYMVKPFEIKSLKELLDHISHIYRKKINNRIDLQVRKEVTKK